MIYRSILTRIRKKVLYSSDKLEIISNLFENNEIKSIWDSTEIHYSSKNYRVGMRK